MLSSNNGKKLFKYVPDYVLFDLETTGVSPLKDRVVEISAVKVKGGKVVDEFSTLVNPGMHIPSRASDVNGIYDDMVEDAPDFETALSDFLEFAGDAVLVGHNINCFDMKFICRDAENFWGQTIGNDYIDTLEIARAYLPELYSHALVDLADYYDISSDGAHRALNDCRMNQQVFECLKKEIDHPSEAAKALKRCPVCGNLLKQRNGKFGTFWGCKSYPSCKYTENL